MDRFRTPVRVTPDKTSLRRAMRTLLAGLSPADRAVAGEAAGARFLDLPEVRAAAVVAAYVGVGDELPTLPLLDALRAAGRVVLLPALRADAALDWRVYEGPGRLVAGPRGLREPDRAAPAATPAEADVVLVPGLAFDAAGRRLGRGGGSYDRALAEPAPPTRLVAALALDAMVVPEVPVDPHDRPVDVLVTPTRVIRRSA